MVRPPQRREHAIIARAQADVVAPYMPIVPARRGLAPPGVDATLLVWAETVAPGGYAHKVVAPGTTIRFSDPEVDACAHLLLFRADQLWERLNVADTVKVQWQAYTTAGQLLLSDQGRVLATVLNDSSGRHDALCGTSTLLHNTERYGGGSPEGSAPAGRELFVVAAAKHGLEPRDLPPSLSFFKGVRVDAASGRLLWLGGCGTPAAIEFEGRTAAGRARGEHHPPARPVTGMARLEPRHHGLARGTDPSGRCRLVVDSRTGAGVPEHRRRPRRTSRVVTVPLCDEVVAAREPWSGTRARRRNARNRRPAREPGRRLPLLRRCGHRRAVQRPRHRGTAGLHLPHEGQRAALEPGSDAAHGHRRRRRAARHPWWSLLEGVQHAPVRAPHQGPACLC